LSRPVAPALCLLVFALTGVAAEAAERPLSLPEVQRLIAVNRYSFSAKQTKVAALYATGALERDGLRSPEDLDELEADIPVITRPAGVQLPDRWDWREDVPGLHPLGVTPVKDQGAFSSCYAFAGVAQLESHALVAEGVLLDLSEQQVVSCSRVGGGSGGWHLDAYSVFLAPGSVTESCFPYEAYPIACAQDGCAPQAAITGFSRVDSDAESVKYALMGGPLFIAIGTGELFYFYAGGVYDAQEPESPADRVLHAVLLVGWDDTLEHESGTGAWIIKNSWSEDWGLEGYAYLSYATTFSGMGPRQLHYAPSSATPLALAEPEGAQAWATGTTRIVSWITDLVPARFELGSVADGVYEALDVAINGGERQTTVTVPPTETAEFFVRVTAYAEDQTVLAVAENPRPLTVVEHRVAWPPHGAVFATPDGGGTVWELVDDEAGGSVALWKDDSGCHASRMSGQGVPLWPGGTIDLPGSVRGAAVADGMGGIYYAYFDFASTSAFLYLTRVAADGQRPWGAGGLRVDNVGEGQEFTSGTSDTPLVTRCADGSVICVWNFQSGSHETVYAQRMAADGARVWDPGTAPGVRVTTRNRAVPLAACRLRSGDVGVAFSCASAGSYDRRDLRVQLLSPAGELVWQAEGVPVRTDVEGEITGGGVQLAAGPADRTVIGWLEARSLGLDLRAQQLAADGSLQWGAEGVLIDRENSTHVLSFELLEDLRGGHLIAWIDETLGWELSVRSQRIALDGSVLWGPEGVLVAEAWGISFHAATKIAAVADGAGGAIVFWPGCDDGNVTSVLAQRVDAAGDLRWCAWGEPVVVDQSARIQFPAVHRDHAGQVSLAWGSDASPDVMNYQRLAGDFPAPPRCDVSAFRLRGDVLTPAGGQVVRGCPGGDADALVVVCDFVDGDLAGAPSVQPADLGLDTSRLGFDVCGASTEDVPGTAANGYRVTLVRRGIVGCSGCLGDGCDPDQVAAGPLWIEYLGERLDAVTGLTVHSYDVNGDGDVDLGEIARLVRRLGRSAGEPGYHGCFDFTGNGTVDRGDLILLIPHLASCVRPGGGAGEPRFRPAGGEALDGDGRVEVIGQTDVRPTAPGTPTLRDPFPNPFNPAATIEFALADPGRVTLAVFDISGHRVKTLIDERLDASRGGYRVVWRGDDDAGRPVASGAYLARLETAGECLTRRLLLLR